MVYIYTKYNLLFKWSSNFNWVPIVQFVKSDKAINEQEIIRHEAMCLYRHLKYIKCHLSYSILVSGIAEVGSLFFMPDLVNI